MTDSLRIRIMKKSIEMIEKAIEDGRKKGNPLILRKIPKQEIKLQEMRRKLQIEMMKEK